MTTTEYREIGDGRREEYQRFKDYAFSPDEGPQDYEDEDYPVDLGDKRGLFVGEELVSVCSIQDFTTRLRGDWYNMGGISAVATPPENRRKGYVAELMSQVLHELDQEYTYFSALWPFSHEFYRRYGWGIVSRFSRYEFEPEILSFVEDGDRPEGGEYRRLGPDDHDKINPAYERYGEKYGLTCKRSEERWKNQLFELWGSDAYVYAWEKDGEIKGYIIYLIREDNDDPFKNVMWVRELVYTDHESHLALLRFLYYHDSQVSEIRMHSPSDSHLLDIVKDPSKVDNKVRVGPMFRVVDMERGVEAIEYPRDVEGEFTVEITDPVMEKNDGVFKLAFEGGSATCEPISIGEPDFRSSINVFSQIFVGYLTPSECAEIGKLEVENHDKLELFDEAYPSENLHLSEFF